MPGESASNSERTPLLDNLARNFAAPLSRFFEQRVDNRHDIPDLVQDVFVKLSAHQNPHAIAKPENYLFVVAANCLRDRFRRDTVRQRAGHDPLDETLPANDEISAFRVASAREGVRRLHAALLALPERRRDIFVLRFFEEWPARDIAEAVGISRRAVEKHYAAATAQVILALEDWRHE